MIQICAVIEVRSFSILERFENEVKSIMQDHGGKIVTAFETNRNENDSGEEIHFLEFESVEKFESYKSDIRLQTLSELRELAISKMVIKVSKRVKFY